MKEQNNYPWSATILKRRLNWFGHLLRLPKTTPARIALEEFAKPTKRPTGRPKTTWLGIVLNDIKKYKNIEIKSDLKYNIANLEQICNNRKNWNKLVGSPMLQVTNVQ